jgi:hypothetical protein
MKRDSSGHTTALRDPALRSNFVKREERNFVLRRKLILWVDVSPRGSLFAQDGACDFVDRRKLDSVDAAKMLLWGHVRGEEVTFAAA